MWHAKNLEKGILPDYLAGYGVTDTALRGSYTRNYSNSLVAPWLWNDTKKVFLSTEDEQSVGAKADYIVDQGAGGAMIWELAGDYRWDATANGGKGERVRPGLDADPADVRQVQGGEPVSWKGHYYQNKWWTKGDDPAAGGAWGVWSDLGAC